MTPIPTGLLTRCGVPLIALAAGWIGGHLPPPGLAAAADAATPLAPLTRLVIEADIRQQIALYGLYVDGDGPGGRRRNLRMLADTLMTPDTVSEVYPANGGAPFRLKGRDAIANSPAPDPERARRIAGRHYLLTTAFDAITPTTAETRTTAVYFDATKNLAGPTCASTGGDACGGAPVKTYMWIYAMSWRKTPQGWQIARNILRDDN